jgi:hypothetical protein
MKPSFCIGLGVLTAVCLAQPSRATILDAGLSSIGGTAEIVDTSTGRAATSTVQLPSFNSALGTLTGVTLEVQGKMDWLFTVSTDSQFPIEVDGSFALSYAVSNGLTGTYGEIDTSTSAIWDSLSDAGDLTVTFDRTITVDPAEFSDPLHPPSVTMVEFVGGSLQGGWLDQQGNNTYGDFYATVDTQFTYTPVPEPCGVAVLVMGLAGLWIVSRRRSFKVA